MKKTILILLTLAAGAAGRDFDHDQREDRIVERGGKAHLESLVAATGKWIDADFQLPEAVAAHPPGDALRFLDLNGDGFDDLVRSDDAGYYMALWSTEVKPQLGWNKGWSQFVRAGDRTGAANEPPSFTRAEARIEEGSLVVVRPGGAETRVALRTLIAVDMPPPMPPREALAAFRVRDGFAVELVAAEPQVIDPVAFDWGPDGRLWVVEMRDYPLGMDGKGLPGGVVKVLEDADRDGRYEKAAIFLDGIPFPTGVMPWRGGVLVSAAPDIFFAEDTDGDGRADRREVLFTGFRPGNEQHRVNGFEWGLDGWIYAANGDSGGTVRSMKTGTNISISGRDVRFRPDTGEIEAVSSQSQFGRRRDDFGNWFGNNNPRWLWHVGLPEHYLRRNPKLAVKGTKRMLANYKDATRVFPVSAAMERPNQPWAANHVTSACSPCPYRDDLFGPEFAASVFVSEPVHNAVHREVLTRHGAGFRSARAEGEENAEFLASTDPWFRPTTLKTGPDGALYIADFYRFITEHPDWISPEMQSRLDLRAGADRGRIYRVVPLDSPRRETPDMSRLAGAALARAMDSPSGWQRDTVQRRLAEPARGKATPEAERVLHDLISARFRPQVRAQALATLGMMRRLRAGEVAAALADPHPAVRIEAARQSEAGAFPKEKTSSIYPALAALADDSNPAVRLQAAFSLGAWPPKLAEPLLARIATRDGEDGDEWIRAAVLSSLQPDSELFKKLNAPDQSAVALPVLALDPAKSARSAVLARYAGVGKLTGDAEAGRVHFQNLCAICHTMGGEGKEVGPDLGMVRGKPVDWLVAAILDPEANIEARYSAWQADLASGGAMIGIVAAETANSLTFRLPGGIERAVLRDDIKELKPAGISLMPAGFEAALDPQAMADLLAWLNK